MSAGSESTVSPTAQPPYSQCIEDVFRHFESSDLGLSDTEVAARVATYGNNRLPMMPPIPAWRRFLSQFNSLFIYVLLASGAASAMLGHYLDSSVIFAVVVINAMVGFVQEGKAEDALRAILSMTKSYCLVMRAGALQTIDSEGLVPGDVVMLQAGDRVPADLRLFYARDFRCDESALTGEAQPVEKSTAPLPVATPLAERCNMALMGTMVTYGVGRGVVTDIGVRTEIGEISRLVGTVELEQTPLQQQLSQFAFQLTLAILFFSLLTIVFGVWVRDFEWGDMFQAAIGIAVAAIPEGLPAVVTIVLAIGVQRMAKRRALVRRLPSVEVLGSVDVICSDKTGTLTANEMTAREAFTGQGFYHVSGEGYRPEGAIILQSTKAAVAPEHDSGFSQACLVAMLCNDSQVAHVGDEWVLHGDPTEGALIVLALKHGLVLSSTQREWPRMDLLPFESEKRYMATLHHNVDGDVRLMVKGAPEKLLSYASHQWGEDGVQPLCLEPWQAAVDQFAGRGMRVMALAVKHYDKKPEVFHHSEVERDLIMVGLVAISDPPRAEAIESIALCHSAGVRVKMITGDNPVTARAIAQELGLDVQRVMTGQELDQLNTDELAATIERVDVFARTSPANKLQIVDALQKHRHVVAMTGDGVNDSPALKKANLGIAMGQKGTDAAKEAADFVLTDDNFATIVTALREGRTVYDNIVKSIVFILPTSLAEALVIVTAIIMGTVMPITPAQVLWVNMITAITLALALAFEQPEAHVMRRPPRPHGKGFFTPALIVRMVLVGSLGAAIVFALFFWYRASGAPIEYARTIAVNTLVLIEMFYLFNCRFLFQSVFGYRFFVGVAPSVYASLTVIVMQLLFTYLPLSQSIFGLQPISGSDWAILAVGASLVLWVVELEKWIQRRLECHRTRVTATAP